MRELSALARRYMGQRLEVTHVVRTQERRIFYLRRAENPPAADDRLNAPGRGAQVPKPVRRAGCCGVCRTAVPDSRAYCSYCVRYVN
jgi:hypothetical protein